MKRLTCLTTIRGIPNAMRSLLSLVVVMLVLPGLSQGCPPPEEPPVGKIAFISYCGSASDLNQDIFIVNADGNNLANLTDDLADDCELAWSPDGTKIAFTSDRSGDINIRNIYVMDADGNNVTDLTKYAAWHGCPAWSPDGRKIAFHSGDDICVIDADGNNLTRLTDGPAGDWGPLWSPDGRKIAFYSGDDICVIDADGNNLSNLTHDPAYDSDLVWSPDGTKIAFTSDRSGDINIRNIYVMDADGNNVTDLTKYAAWHGCPAWSPDGQKIAFTSRRQGHFDIYVMDANGSNVTKLTDDSAQDWGPEWSPDGRKIAFYRGGIYVINADGTNQMKLASGCYNDCLPAWSPTGVSTPVIAVTSPNGDESWSAFETHTIRWSSFAISGNVKIELSRDGPDGPWETIIPDTPNDGSEQCELTGLGTNEARIKITSGVISDVSDDDFTILGPISITVTSPNGGESYDVGNTLTIAWKSFSIPSSANVRIELSRDGPDGPWETIISDTPNDGSESWQVMGPRTARARVKVASGIISDTSDDDFTIRGPLPIMLTVTSPNGAEVWTVGSTETITWDSSGIIGNVFAVGLGGTILYYDGSTWSQMSSPTSNWLRTVWGSSGTRVFAVGDGGTILYYDGSTWSQMSSPTSESLSDVWGSSENDVFAVGGSGTILRYDGSTWSQMPSPSSNFLSGVWGCSREDIIAVGSSGAIFDYDGVNWNQISSPTSKWLYGIWGSGAKVNIELSRDGSDGTWTTIIPNTRNDGSESWQVTGPSTLEARIRVSSGPVSDISDGDFTIVGVVPSCPVGQFYAEYYNYTHGGEPTFTGEPMYTCCEDSINRDWDEGGPTFGVGNEYFLARWTGQFDFAGGNYTFIARVDDGIRLWVDGSLIINEWRPQVVTEFTATRDLTPGRHEVKVEYFERMGLAICQVRWEKVVMTPIPREAKPSE